MTGPPNPATGTVAEAIRRQVQKLRDQPSGWAAVDVTPWLPMEPVRTGFGGITYWRSTTRTLGRHTWRITTGKATP